ncbi:MAG: hypothetical protein R3Y56_02255 [Akkermansia sp.]
MSIVNNSPAFRLDYGDDLKATPHKHEGKFAIVTDGKIAIASAATPLVYGVIADPDAYATAQAGNLTGATLIGLSFPGVVQVQVGSSGSVTAHSTLFALNDDGTVSASSGANGDIIVARAAETTNTVAGSLVAATLINPPRCIVTNVDDASDTNNDTSAQ